MQDTTAKKPDLIHGTLWSSILLYALPVAATAILEQLFNASDVAVVGNFSVGDKTVAVAAVGANSSVIGLLLNFFIGISLGATVVIANAIGRNDKQVVHRAVHTAIFMALAGGVLVAALGEAFAKPLLSTLNVPDDVFPYALLYLRIYLLGMPVILLYNFEAAIFRSIGDTRTPLIALTLSGVLNVVLNLFFVLVLKMTVNGVATATVLANCFSSLVLLRRLLTTDLPVRVTLRDLGIDVHIFKKIMSIGLPSGIQSAVFSISNIVIQSAINSLGKVVMAASSAACNIEVFAYDVMNSYNQACTTFVGQNYGAGQIRRCRKTLYLCLIEDAVSLGATVALVLLTGRFLLSIFNNDPQVIALGYDRLKIVFFAYIFSLLYEVMSGYLRGFGISLVPAALTALGVCGIRIAWIHFVFPQHPTLQTIMTSYPVSLSATALMIFIALLCYRPARKHAAMEREPAPAGK